MKNSPEGFNKKISAEKIDKSKERIVNEEKIQEKYAEYLSTLKFSNDIPPEILQELESWQETTGIKVSKETAQKAANTLLLRGNFNSVKRIQEITGVKPNLPEETIQREYESFCTVETEGTRPFVPIYGLEELYKITGIKPKIPEDIVQKAYAHLFDYREADGIKRLEKITGIKPSKEILKKQKDH